MVKRDFATLDSICSLPDAPEDLLLDLTQFPELHGVLGHRAGPLSLLWKMADDHHYPEAVLALGKHLYLEDSVPCRDFEEFATRHRDSLWMLDSLVRLQPKCDQKSKALLRVIAMHQDAERLEAEYARCRRAEGARSEQDSARLLEFYKTGEPSLLLALAGNPNTPLEVLHSLCEVQQIPGAQSIRRAAAENLAQHGA